MKPWGPGSNISGGRVRDSKDLNQRSGLPGFVAAPLNPGDMVPGFQSPLAKMSLFAAPNVGLISHFSAIWGEFNEACPGRRILPLAIVGDGEDPDLRFDWEASFK